jgi:hypothetical protein
MRCAIFSQSNVKLAHKNHHTTGRYVSDRMVDDNAGNTYSLYLWKHQTKRHLVGSLAAHEGNWVVTLGSVPIYTRSCLRRILF